MPIVLIRIDDRLIHGQVTVGWGSYLNPDRIVLVSNEIALNEWEKELYQNCVPFNFAVSILTIDDTIDSLKKKTFNDERVIILGESPEIFVELVKKGAKFQQINIGGMHFNENKLKILSFIFVSKKDIEDFKYLQEKEIELICQDLPQAKKNNLSELLPQ